MQQTNPTSPTTQRRITLIRHAKAAEDGASDIERALSPRGETDAAVLGKWLCEQHALPELFICSTAKRTRQTLDAFAAIVPTMLTERLYLASAKDILKLIGEMDDEVRHVAVIGHNPGLHQLAAQLAGEYRNEADAERLALKFPTAACAMFSLSLDHWYDINPSATRLENYITR
jgi:phosphohistidine phosphatase